MLIPINMAERLNNANLFLIPDRASRNVISIRLHRCMGGNLSPKFQFEGLHTKLWYQVGIATCLPSGCRTMLGCVIV